MLWRGDPRHEVQREAMTPRSAVLPNAFGKPERVRYPDDHVARVKPIDVVAAVLRVHAGGVRTCAMMDAPNTSARPDARTVCDVGLVGKACTLTRVVLHDDIHARVGQSVHRGRHQCHACLSPGTSL